MNKLGVSLIILIIHLLQIDIIFGDNYFTSSSFVSNSDKMQGVLKNSGSSALIIMNSQTNQKIYEINSSTNTFKTPFQQSNFKFLKGYYFTNEKLILAFGNHLLYFCSPSTLSKIGEPVEYDSINKDNLEATFLDVIEDTNEKKIYGLIGFSQPLTKKLYINSYLINDKENSFTLDKTLTMDLSSNSGSLNNINCNFMKNQTVILCMYNVPGTNKITIGLISEDFQQIEKTKTIDVVESTENKMIKIAYDRVFMSYFGTDNSVKYSLIRISEEKKNEKYELLINIDNPNSNISYLKDKEVKKISLSYGNGGLLNLFSYKKDNKYYLELLWFVVYGGVYIDQFTSPIETEGEVENAGVITFDGAGDKGLFYSVSNKVNSIIFSKILYCNFISKQGYSGQEYNIKYSQMTQNVLPGITCHIEGTNALIDDTQKQIQFTGKSSGTFLFNYKFNITQPHNYSSPRCFFSITSCNVACSSCEVFSNNVDNTKCLACAQNYVGHEGETNLRRAQCTHISRKIDRFYYNSTEEGGKGKFMKCYHSCQRCDGPKTDTSHNCLVSSCQKGFIYFPETKSCNCEYWIKEKENELCLEGCTKENPYHVSTRGECVKRCDTEQVYRKTYFDACVEICPPESEEKNLICRTSYEEVINIIDKKIRGLANIKKISDTKDHAKYEIIELGIDTISSTANISTIDLGKCEEKLKEINGIPQSEGLLLFKIDINREDQVTNQVEYAVYSMKGEKLDLSECQDEKIKINVPINENSGIDFEKASLGVKYGYDIFNSSDPFYNNVCTPFKTTHGTDIIIEDRKKDFYQSVPFCETGCEYQGVDVELKRVNCDCNIKKELQVDASTFSINKIADSFKNVISYSNLRVVICYKFPFNASNLVENIGSWIMIILGILEIVMIFLYFKNGIKPLEKMIQVFLKKNNGTISYDTLENQRTIACPPKKIKIKLKEQYLKQSVPIKEVSEKKEETFQKVSTYNRDKVTSIGQSESNTFGNDAASNTPSVKKILFRFPRRRRFIDDITEKKEEIVQKPPKDDLVSKETDNEKPDDKLTIRVKLQKKDVVKTPGSIVQTDAPLKNEPERREEVKKDFTDEDINNLKFEEVKEYDKRSLWRMYWSFLKYDQLIIFTFITSTDFNLKPLKIALFIFSFALFMTFNALFYSDSSMSHNYHIEGKFDFIYELPKAIFSSIACGAINFLLHFLSLSQSEIEKIKNNENKKNSLELLAQKILARIKIKFLIFFILTMSFMALFWYYISAFCIVFKNTQKNMIIDTVTSFILSMLEPFGVCFLVAAFRLLSIKYNSKVLFYISKLFGFL